MRYQTISMAKKENPTPQAAITTKVAKGLADAAASASPGLDAGGTSRSASTWECQRASAAITTFSNAAHQRVSCTPSHSMATKVERKEPSTAPRVLMA
jgi:hypothetical protein